MKISKLCGDCIICVCELTCRLAELDLTLNCRHEMSAQKLGGLGGGPVATPVPTPLRRCTRVWPGAQSSSQARIIAISVPGTTAACTQLHS